MLALVFRGCRWAALLFVVAAATGCPVQTWVKAYGGSGEEEARAVVATSDGGYIVAAFSESFGDASQMYALKLDEEGFPGFPIFIPFLSQPR